MEKAVGERIVIAHLESVGTRWERTQEVHCAFFPGESMDFEVMVRRKWLIHYVCKG